MRIAWAGKPLQALSLVLFVALLVESSFLVWNLAHPSGDPALQGPPNIPIPAHSTLSRTENLVTQQARNWYYSVPQFSVHDVQSFYQPRLQADGWKCITSMESINPQQQGQPVAGAGIFITAVRGTTKVEVNAGTLAYGESILDDMLDPGAVALKLTMEPAQAGECGTTGHSAAPITPVTMVRILLSGYTRLGDVQQEE
jgi:hypothetical protein